MLTLMLGTVILALTYGAFWHNQPARRQNNERGDDEFLFGRLVTRALEWLLLMPHVSNPLEKSGHIIRTEKGVIPVRRSELFRPVLRALRGLKPRHRLLVDRTAVTVVELSIPGDSLEKANTHALAAGRTT